MTRAVRVSSSASLVLLHADVSVAPDPSTYATVLLWLPVKVASQGVLSFFIQFHFLLLVLLRRLRRCFSGLLPRARHLPPRRLPRRPHGLSHLLQWCRLPQRSCWHWWHHVHLRRHGHHHLVLQHVWWRGIGEWGTVRHGAHRHGGHCARHSLQALWLALWLRLGNVRRPRPPRSVLLLVLLPPSLNQVCCLSCSHRLLRLLAQL
mmetsp:Transcript_28921/g.62937  ORF Transcript_28921/g.62937 Transcript_28921/m.62937 type:complete len:205 (-) Transcript_28921:230-844(-)